MNASSCSGAIPSLPGSRATLPRPGSPIRALPRPVTCELAQDGFGGDRVDQPHVRHDRLDLATLQPADEVPREHSPCAATFAPDPAPGSRRRARRRPRRAPVDPPPTHTWSGRAPRPRPAPVRPRQPPRRSPRAPVRGSPARCRRAGGRSAQPRDSPLPARAHAFAAIGEEALVADRAGSYVPHFGDSRRQETITRDRLQVDASGGDPTR